MHTASRGISLIEVLVAMTIFAFGVLGMLGLQARAMSEASDSRYRTDAALLSDALINQVWDDRANIANYAYGGSGTAPAAVQGWLNQVQVALPKGNAIVTVNGGNQVAVQVTWQPPNAPQHQHTEIATIQNP